MNVPLDAATAQLPVVPDARGLRAIAPTDVSQFIRLDQCRRYLRLRLHARNRGGAPDFMAAYDVTPQSIPPLLTRSGTRFEQATEASVPAELRLNLAEERRAVGGRTSDNARVVALARELSAGAVRVVFQPRLMAELGGWRLRGDIDILRMERDASGDLHLLIADMKSSTSTKVEHRLQVAFYHEMLAKILAEAGIAHQPITMAVLYRGPAEDDAGLTPEMRERHAAQRAEAQRVLWAESGLLEYVENPAHYLGEVRALVTDPASVARQTADAPFTSLPWHLSYKCDGCIYNEFCMKWAAEHDDLSLLPHLSATEKTALQALGITTTRDLVDLRVPGDGSGALVPAPGKEALNRRVAATWPVGPRIDELVHRARAYRRFKGDDLTTVGYLPAGGHGSLPYCDAEHNPNLVRVYIDAQHDYLHDRVYLLGALVTACAGGAPDERRRRTVVHMTNGPPSAPAAEERLFTRWIADTIRAIRELAAPDAAGEPKAPIHLIFYDAYAQRVVLHGLSRHLSRVLGATPLYDFMTQFAAFDSPVVSLLEREIRERRNFPMVCQSLQAVAAYLKFDWRTPHDFRKLFRARMFDFWGALGEDEAGNRVDWYTSRSRFSSQVPLEYAYAAWGDLDRPAEKGAGHDYRRYRGATVELVRAFAARRLEAIEHIALTFDGNEKTAKTPFDLTRLDAFEDRSRSLAEALCEFVAIERHVELAAWKSARLLAPERRVLTGETLVVRFLEEDQHPGVAEENREHARLEARRARYAADFRAANPDAPKVELSKEQRAETQWDATGLRIRLRIITEGVDCDLDEILGLTTLAEGARVVVYDRWASDSRLPEAERVKFQPTPKQMLYGMRATIESIQVEPDPVGNRTGYVELVIEAPWNGRSNEFTFGHWHRPFVHGEVYTLDPDPNDFSGSTQKRVVEGIRAGEPNVLYQRLLDLSAATVDWPPVAAQAQRRFLEGLQALHAEGALHAFGPGQREYIGARGADPVLLVQGPPGTGKSYSTAFALFARLQGAIAAGQDYRVVVSCKTHAAIDVLLDAVSQAQARLRLWRDAYPAIFQAYFDPALLDIPLLRFDPQETIPVGVRAVYKQRDERRMAGQPGPIAALLEQRWCVVAMTPGGVYRMLVDAYSAKMIFGHRFVDCLILDEASQMNLPEAIMAALPLKERGQVIVVGDHRQMPPIVHHDWASEPRRTFQEYRTYQSLFDTFREQQLRMVQFDESFRLHRDMAEFLREEIYRHDGIAFHAKHAHRLDPMPTADPLVAAVLDPEVPLVVVVHGEARSQMRNPFEQRLIEPVLTTIASAIGDPEEVVRERLGVVVPHRAQRAAVQAGIPAVCLRDPRSGLVVQSSVDTVERFQGDERDTILVSATESDPEYLLVSTKFLLDPRRLTVAISRARRKLVLVASRSVFNVFSADEETFANAQIWKNLLRRTCTELLWAGEREWENQLIPVEVWGKRADP